MIIKYIRAQNVFRLSVFRAQIVFTWSAHRAQIELLCYQRKMERNFDELAFMQLERNECNECNERNEFNERKSNLKEADLRNQSATAPYK